jgi:hypothetical protein
MDVFNKRIVVWNQNESAQGRLKSRTSECSAHADCNGVRLDKRWPDGYRSWACADALVIRDDNYLQITQSTELHIAHEKDSRHE